MKKSFFLIILISSIFSAYATHNLSGYISTKHVSGLEYEITVTIIADEASPAVDRRDIAINYGDNTRQDTIFVSSQVPIQQGQLRLLERKFVTKHTFPGPAEYFIRIEVPNRSANIVNINNSINIPFYISTSFKVSTFQNVSNHTPSISSNLVTHTGVNQPFIYNLAAHDIDGDFLTYHLVPTKGPNGLNAPGYFIPSGMSIDLINGELNWHPQNTGTYVFTIEITECRNENFISTTNVDFMVLVTDNSSGNPSMFMGNFLTDTNRLGNISFTLFPGDTLNLNVQEANGNDITLANKNITNQTFFNTNSGDFQWISTPNSLRCAPYLFVFETRNNSFNEEAKHLSILVEIRDSTQLNCDTLCGYNIISVPEISSPTLESKVFPNPFSEFARIKILGKNSSSYIFRLYNSEGKLIREEAIIGGEMIFNRKRLSSGAYFYTLSNTEGNFGNGKLLIQ